MAVVSSGGGGMWQRGDRIDGKRSDKSSVVPAPIGRSQQQGHTQAPPMDPIRTHPFLAAAADCGVDGGHQRRQRLVRAAQDRLPAGVEPPLPGLIGDGQPPFGCRVGSHLMTVGQAEREGRGTVG